MTSDAWEFVLAMFDVIRAMIWFAAGFAFGVWSTVRSIMKGQVEIKTVIKKIDP